MAGALAARGVGAGDVVMTVVGNRPEWVYAMLACWRIGAVAQPRARSSCGPRDLRARMERSSPRPWWPTRATSTWCRRAASTGRVLAVPDERSVAHEPVAGGGLRGRPPRADRLHLRHRRRAEADPPRARLPARAERAGRALVRRAAGRPVLVHRRERLVAVGAQRVRGRVAARAPPRCCTTRRFDPEERLELLEPRARERALHVAHRVPRDREARARSGRPPACGMPAPRASRSTPRSCGRGRRTRACRCTTATARPRPAT